MANVGSRTNTDVLRDSADHGGDEELRESLHEAADTIESLQAEVERLRQSIDHMVWWLISENYEHAASSLAVYLYPGSAAPLRRYAQDHPEYAPVIDEISWVPKVTT